MTERQQIEAMLARLKIKAFNSDADTSDPGSEPGAVIEVTGQPGNDAVCSSSHCYVRFTFDVEGKLTCLDFGY